MRWAKSGGFGGRQIHSSETIDPAKFSALRAPGNNPLTIPNITLPAGARFGCDAV
jgi:hypothetical protein